MELNGHGIYFDRLAMEIEQQKETCHFQQQAAKEDLHSGLTRSTEHPIDTISLSFILGNIGQVSIILYAFMDISS